MPLLRERLEQPNKQPNSFPASTGQDSCRRAVRIVDIDHLLPFYKLGDAVRYDLERVRQALRGMEEGGTGARG